jgi:hypothetical protein
MGSSRVFIAENDATSTRPPSGARTERRWRTHGDRAPVPHPRPSAGAARAPHPAAPAAAACACRASSAAGRPYADVDGGGEGSETASGTDAPWYPRPRGGHGGAGAVGSGGEPASSADELETRMESASGRGASGMRG